MLAALAHGPAYIDGFAADVYAWGAMLYQGAQQP